MHCWKPVFSVESYCFGYCIHTDVAKAVPASTRTLSEIHQEGIRIPPLKSYVVEFNKEVLDIMLTNVRMPEQNWGDLKAQITFMNTVERRSRDY